MEIYQQQKKASERFTDGYGLYITKNRLNFDDAQSFTDRNVGGLRLPRIKPSLEFARFITLLSSFPK